MAKGRSHTTQPVSDAGTESKEKESSSQSLSKFVIDYARQRHGSRLLAGEGNILLGALQSAGVKVLVTPLMTAHEGKSVVVGKTLRINQPILIVIDETDDGL